MKKFLALTLALILAFSLVLVSCSEDDSAENASEELAEKNQALKDAFAGIGSNGALTTLHGKTPEQLYATASQNINVADNLTLIAEQDIIAHVEQDGQVFDQTVKQSIIQKFDGDNFSIVANNEIGESEMNCQYVGGMVYNVQITDGMKIKYEATPQQLYEKLNMDPDEPKVLSVPESWFKDVCFYEDEKTDRYYITFSLEGYEYEKLFSNLNFFNNVDINNVSDVNYTVYFTADGEIDSMISTASMIIEGITVNYVTTTTCKDIDNTTIEAPANADSYILVDISQVG